MKPLDPTAREKITPDQRTAILAAAASMTAATGKRPTRLVLRRGSYLIDKLGRVRRWPRRKK